MSLPNTGSDDAAAGVREMEENDGVSTNDTTQQGNQQAAQQAVQQVLQHNTEQLTPWHPFYRLPPELILDIVDILPPESFINFAFANYPLLHANGLAPSLSGPRVSHITSNTNLPALFPLIGRLPAELMLHIMRNLRPVDVMRFVLANYQTLARQGIAPPLTDETAQQLWNAVRARLPPG